jgi:hypothetical protein
VPTGFDESLKGYRFLSYLFLDFFMPKVEVVNGKRSISKTQAKALAEFFHVSPELFI